jgi:hypothetical protein
MELNFETCLSAISRGTPADIPPGWLAQLIQKDYCNQQCKIDLSAIPVNLYYCCHSNMNRLIDNSRRLLLMFPETESP